MSSRLRALAIVELLTLYPGGLTARAIAQRLDIPLAATDRLLQVLVQTDYVRLGPGQVYQLRLKLAALGLAYLGASGVTDLVQPILDDLAKRTGELVRLAVIERDRLTWVAKAQGSRSGLMYNPDVHAEIDLPETANGQAWLACLPPQDAEALLAKLPPARRKRLQQRLAVCQRLGYAFVSQSDQTGTSALAVAIRKPATGLPIGTVSVAGPALRMTQSRVAEMAGWLSATAAELARASASSPLFGAR